MAEQEIGKLNVVVGLDNSGFQNGITNINRSLKVVQSEFQAAAAKVGDFGTSTDGLKLKADSLTKQIDLQKQKVDALKQAYDKSVETKGADAKASQDLEIKLNKASQTLSKMESDLKNTTTQLKEQSSALGKLGKDYKETFDQAKNSMGNSFDKFKTAGTAITGAGVGLGLAIGDMVKKTADFDSQMSKVQALSGSSAEEFDQLRKKAIELGADTSFSASQAAEGMTMLAAGGMDANQIMDAMPGVLAAAAASGENMALVADTMSSALNGFGLEAKDAGHVADVVAQSANMSAIGVEDMAYSFKYAAPVAKSLGISMEEVSAAVVEMGNAGIKGETAGTTLREALLRLVSPPKEAKDELNKLGVSIVDSSGKMKPLGDIIGQLNTKMEGMTQAQKAAALSAIFGTNSVSGMMVLIDQGKNKFDEYTNSLVNSNGASQKAADIMKNNLKGSLEQLSGSWEAMSISIGTALSPALKTLADMMTNLVNKFNELSPTAQTTVAVTGAIAAGLLLLGGPILFLVGSIPTIMAGFTALGTVFAVLTGPIGLTVAAVVALGVAAYELYSHWDTVKVKLIQLWDSIKTKASEVWDGIKSYFSGVWNDVKTEVGSSWDGIKTTLSQKWEEVKSSISTSWDNLKTVASTTWNDIKGSVVGAFEWMYNHNYYFKDLVDIISKAWDDVKKKADEIWSNLKEEFQKTVDDLKEKWNGLWTAIGNKVGEAWNELSQDFTKLWTSISGWFTKLITDGENWVKDMFTRISGVVGGAWNTLASSFSSLFGSISGWFTSLVNDAKTWGENLMKTFVDGFLSKMSDLWNAVKSAAKTVSDFLGFHSPTKLGPGSDADVWAPNLVKMYAKGIDDNLPLLQGSLNRMASNLQSGLGGTTNQYGANTFMITIQNPSSMGQAQELKRQLQRLGVRFNG